MNRMPREENVEATKKSAKNEAVLYLIDEEKCRIFGKFVVNRRI